MRNINLHASNSVEVLDQLFNNVCELDIIFNFTQAYFCLDEIILGGEVQETSKREILRVCAAQDEQMEDDDAGRGFSIPGVRS